MLTHFVRLQFFVVPDSAPRFEAFRFVFRVGFRSESALDLLRKPPALDSASVVVSRQVLVGVFACREKEWLAVFFDDLAVQGAKRSERKVDGAA
jgi:hypothetical protein